MVTFPAAKYSSAEQLIAAIDWWRSAGVDHDFADDAQNWLAREPDPDPAPPAAPAAPAAAVTAPPPLARIGGDPAAWPQDLPGFQAWWLAEASLDDGQVSGRVPPRGPIGADVMVMIDHPEAHDRDQLLSGPQGRLANAIIASLGLAAEAVYWASVLPRHMPLPDWTDLATRGLGDVARHHVALVAPKRLIGFGGHVSSLLGHDPSKSAQALPQIWRLGSAPAALAAPDLDSLMARPAGKARLWQALLDWQTD